MAQVNWSIAARNDLLEIAAYIARDSPAQARAFVRRLRQAGNSLRVFPERGRIVPDLDDPEMRELIVQGYRIMYRLRDGRVGIAAVIHGSRDISRLPPRDWRFD